ncbi:hypothetical protein QBC34DRAFT_416882 [Podospora aff. communis PSN243]|uniref:Uncharacterized protein n=1 Tax=Podospora aff. communis PSN243 TaxID=3040156 RepID=A0AAV9G6A2_9PEZI|nr:hypothetical protein QBC34DRAFT_416882 [Podospora aff. communis PSN243]
MDQASAGPRYGNDSELNGIREPDSSHKTDNTDSFYEHGEPDEAILAKVKNTAGWLRKRPQCTGLEHVKMMSPRVYIGEWTIEDRRPADTQWAKHPHREDLINVAGQKELLTLHKATLQVMQCLPEDIVSLRYHMAYDISQNDSPSWCWSASFCTLLTDLILHPMWAGDKDLFIRGLLYAILQADTRDKRRWLQKLDTMVEEFPHFGRFHAALDDEDTTDTRADACMDASNYGPFVIEWELLFRAINEAVKKKGRHHQDDSQSPLLKVHSRHLELLAEGLETMGTTLNGLGVPRFRTVDHYSRIVQVAGGGFDHDYPLDTDIKALREYSQMRQHDEMKAYEREFGVTVYRDRSTPPPKRTATALAPESQELPPQRSPKGWDESTEELYPQPNFAEMWERWPDWARQEELDSGDPDHDHLAGYVIQGVTPFWLRKQFYDS